MDGRKADTGPVLGEKKTEAVKPGKLRNTQMFFGGLPLSTNPASMVVDQEATPEQLEQMKQRRDRPKKFSTEAFLDLFMKEQRKPLTTFA